MSRWLKSVNTILDKLDDRAENVAEDASAALVDADGVPVGSAALTGITNRFLGQAANNSESEDGSYYEDDEYYDDEEEYEEEEDGEEEEVTFEQDETNEINAPTDRNTVAVSVEEQPYEPTTRQDDHDQKPAMPSEPQSIPKAKPAVEIPTPKPDTTVETTPAVEKSSDKDLKNAASKTVASIDRVVKAPSSSGQRRSQLPPAPRSNTSTSGSKSSDLQKDLQRLVKQNATLQTQLDAAQEELQAQNVELEQAAQRMTEDRQLADEEREELLDEHEDALRNLKASYEAKLEDQKLKFQKEMQDVRQRLANEAQMRAKEGGDMNEELVDSIERERKALERIDELEREKTELVSSNEKLKTLGDALRDDVKRLTEAAQTSTEREHQAEERLDAANSAHQRAIVNRQSREAELERTVAQLGAALALKKESGVNPSGISISTDTGADTMSRQAYDMVVEELDGAKAQLRTANERCDALQNELQILSRERTEEAAVAQEKDQRYAEKLEQMTFKISHLEASLREYKTTYDDSTSGSSTLPGKNDLSAQDSSKVRQLTRDLDKSRRQIASLSDQLLRQQGLTESTKSEVLALRGRLQSATARAEAAEQAGGDVSSRRNMLELESGGVGYGAVQRKRIKMRGGVSQRGGGRTMRSALGLRASDSSPLDQVAQTCDALDFFMLETGVILRGEPMARLGLLVYMLILHLWCFGLVFFHAVESEHGDLGSLTARRPVLSVAQHHSP